MKIIRWWGISAFLVLAVILILAWYLVAPMVFKSSLENAGTKLLGAKFDVAQVELHLFPLGVTVNGIEAADPERPMINLFEIDSVKFAVDSSKLLWKKILIDELKIDGFQLGTKRKNSGSIDVSDGSDSSDESSSVSRFDTIFSKISKDDIKQLVEDADLITLKKLKELEDKQRNAKQFWQKEIENTQHEEILKAIETEFNRLTKRAKSNSFNLIKDRKAWKKLKKDISKERKAISGLNRKLKTDKKELSKAILNIKNSPQQDLDNLISKTGLNSGLSGMSKKLSDQLIGPQFTPWVEKIVTFIKQNKNVSDQQSDSNTVIRETNKGTMVQFKDQQIFPKILIKTVSLSGKDNRWSTLGKGKNLGYYPWVIGKPADLNIELKGIADNSRALLAITSEWKNSKEMNAEIRSNMLNWKIKNIKLLQSEQGNWMINSGSLNASLDGQISLEQIDIKLSLAITNANIQSPSNLSGWQNSLSTSLANQKLINITVTAKGNLDQPNISMKTNLEKMLSSAISENLKIQTAKYKKEFKEQISQRVGDLTALDGLSDDFEKWTKALKNNDNLLENLKISL